MQFQDSFGISMFYLHHFSTVPSNVDWMNSNDYSWEGIFLYNTYEVSPQINLILQHVLLFANSQSRVFRKIRKAFHFIILCMQNIARAGSFSQRWDICIIFDGETHIEIFKNHFEADHGTWNWLVAILSWRKKKNFIVTFQWSEEMVDCIAMTASAWIRGWNFWAWHEKWHYSDSL